MWPFPLLGPYVYFISAISAISARKKDRSEHEGQPNVRVHTHIHSHKHTYTHTHKASVLYTVQTVLSPFCPVPISVVDDSHLLLLLALHSPFGQGCPPSSTLTIQGPPNRIQSFRSIRTAEIVTQGCIQIVMNIVVELLLCDVVKLYLWLY